MTILFYLESYISSSLYWKETNFAYTFIEWLNEARLQVDISLVFRLSVCTAVHGYLKNILIYLSPSWAKLLYVYGLTYFKVREITEFSFVLGWYVIY